MSLSNRYTCHFTLFILQLFCFLGTYAQTPDRKTFPGEHWSTKPDTTAQRKFWGFVSFGLGIKNENLSFPSQYPWMVGGPPGNLYGLSFEGDFGSPSKFSICLPFLLASSGKQGSYSDAYYTYNCNISALTFSAGALIGRQLLPRSHSPWLRGFIPSIGFIYESSSISSTCTSPSLPNTTINYAYNTGNILFRAQLLYEIPGYYITGRASKAVMNALGLMLKAGYDLSLVNYSGSSTTGNAIPLNLSGFYCGVGFYINSYVNKPLLKQEQDEQMKAQMKQNADTSGIIYRRFFGIGAAGGCAFSNYNAIRQYPWMLGSPSNILPEFSANLCFGSADNFLSVPITAGVYNKTGNFSDSNATFNSTVSTTIVTLGLQVGRELIHNDTRHFLNGLYLLAGVLYNVSLNSADFIKNNTTGKDDMAEYDIAGYLLNLQATIDVFSIDINKNGSKSRFEFVLTPGYNIRMYEQWQPSSVFAGNLIPGNVNISGPYILAGFYYWVYFKKHSK